MAYYTGDSFEIYTDFPNEDRAKHYLSVEYIDSEWGPEEVELDALVVYKALKEYFGENTP